MRRDRLAHCFRDGDVVTLVMRLEDGGRTEMTVDYGGIRQDGDETYLWYHLYRDDGCTDDVPLRKIEQIRLVRTLQDRLRANDPTLDDVPFFPE